MAALHIRDLDDSVVSRLKERAARHNRSLQREVKTILEKAVAPPTGRRAGRTKLKLHTVHIASGATYSRDEIYGDEGR
jgi:plasmid stability protein